MSDKDKIKIYLGSLGHFTTVLTNNVTPINIGFLASFLQKHFPDKVELHLFNHPQILIDTIHKDTPDVVGLSNYVWNHSISGMILESFKQINPEGITIWGGPHFPVNEINKAKKFLLSKPYVDFYVPFEGELAVLNIVKAIIEENKNPEYFKGSCFISNREYIKTDSNTIVENLDAIPSPFLTGFMDKFLEAGAHPMIQTQRGCPFACAYCSAPHSNVRPFSVERIKQEIKYIADKIPNPTEAHLVIADTNFGMYEKDVEIASFLEKIYQKTNFPNSIELSTGKSRKDIIIKTTEKCSKLILSMGIQSLDDKVLKAINRINPPIYELAEHHRRVGMERKISEPEIILGLPLETKKSHLQTMRKIIKRINPTGICQYTLMLLPGTELFTDNARAKYKYNAKFRLIPTGFGDYLSKKCFEIEEVSVGTKDMNFKDYLEMREIFFFVKNVYSNQIFNRLIKYLNHLDEDVIDFFLTASKARQFLEKNNFAFNIIDKYLKDTKEELFKTEKDLVEYFSQEKHYQKLLQGKKGINLAHTYKLLVLLNIKEWASFVVSCFRKFIEQKHGNDEKIMKLTEDIIKHTNVQAECQHRFFNKEGSIPSEASPIKVEFDKVVYSYFMSSDAIRFSQSFTKSQSTVEKALILLRSDFNHIFPLYKKLKTEV